MWDPFKNMDTLFKQLQGMGGDGFFSSSARGSWVPAMDVTESEKGYTVTADIPGTKKDDVEVVYDAGRLCISGDRPRTLLGEGDSGSKDSQWLIMVERGYGRFERCLQLPHRVNEGTIRARFSEGILEVSMDKAEPKSTTRGGSRISIN